MPVYPDSVRDSAKSGLGCLDNRHLNYLVESVLINVGGFRGDVKVSSSTKAPGRTTQVGSVGVAIVVGGRESLPQGEGPQLVGSKAN